MAAKCVLLLITSNCCLSNTAKFESMMRVDWLILYNLKLTFLCKIRSRKWVCLDWLKNCEDPLRSWSLEASRSWVLSQLHISIAMGMFLIGTRSSQSSFLNYHPVNYSSTHLLWSIPGKKRWPRPPTTCRSWSTSWRRRRWRRRGGRRSCRWQPLVLILLTLSQKVIRALVIAPFVSHVTRI